MKKLITLDCYGTLVDTSSFAEEVAKIGEENHLDGSMVSSIYTLNEARLMYAEPFLPLDQLIKTALIRCDIMMGTDFMHKYTERLIAAQSSLKAFPDVVPALKELRSRGFHLVIMSNSCDSIMKHNLKELDHQIDELVLAEDVKAYKPQLSFFEKSEALLDVKNREHCHVAQGYFEDIIPCSRLGWNKIWVNRKQEKGIGEQMPYKEVGNLDEIFEHL